MPGFRMFEAQYMGMKGLAIKPGQGVAGFRAEQRRLGLESGPIDAIADERMAGLGEMYPEQVGRGRIPPPMPDRLSPQWAIRALTSVPVQFPAAGCTTSPAGLSITISSASS